MQALEGLALTEYCTRTFRALSPGVRLEPATLDILREAVFFLASLGIRDEDDVERLIRISWPKGTVVLRRDDVLEILSDQERAPWLRTMQAVRVLEAARG